MQTAPTLADIRIAAFTPAHIPGALALSQAAGWPHRAEDWALALAVSQGVVALAGDAVLGTALCTPFGAVATINMIIVAESCRGQGLGRRLMDQVLALGAGAELRLVATEDGLPLYRKLGFAPVGQVVQCQGIATPTADAPDLAGMPDLELLIAADRAATGMDRGALLQRIAAGGAGFACADGQALLRPFGRGHVLGPVIARSPEAARALILAAARHCAGQFLRIDLPQEAGLADFVATLGLHPVGGGVAMVRGAAPRPVSDFNTYALAAQAFG